MAALSLALRKIRECLDGRGKGSSVLGRQSGNPFAPSEVMWAANPNGARVCFLGFLRERRKGILRGIRGSDIGERIACALCDNRFMQPAFKPLWQSEKMKSLANANAFIMDTPSGFDDTVIARGR